MGLHGVGHDWSDLAAAAAALPEDGHLGSAHLIMYHRLLEPVTGQGSGRGNLQSITLTFSVIWTTWRKDCCTTDVKKAQNENTSLVTKPMTGHEESLCPQQRRLGSFSVRIKTRTNSEKDKNCRLSFIVNYFLCVINNVIVPLPLWNW